MGGYRDYVSDFPHRCSELLEGLRFKTSRMDLDVTHLLSLTTVGLIVPHERLRGGAETPHPSGDRSRYEDAASEYDGLLKRYFVSPPLCPGGPATWRKGRIADATVQAPGFREAFESAEPVKRDVKAKTVVGILRNALAHGNIVTKDWGRRSGINEIMFLSQHRYPTFRLVAVEPEDLRKFMMNYFAFLSELDLGRGRLIGGTPEAA